ncbi:MAG: ABC transporter permease [Thermogemmatispora sp.]|jgi:putative ABC transport system permease protein|uniref:ABC transporter permease n=1 Tax=Thermogemmatispora sp. TaxID=1968838 RepID=UPI001A101CE4|nr:FtsX-like permease family protein [Thermogemmatispora sp.]MBE3564681.1 ABC transporter permease [Thermogemmatispora sp.]
MKASLYFKYAWRSLLRGGQRSVLAILCIAVGVLAIVSLELVGQMINLAFTSNVREANGGDVAVAAYVHPFNNTDLAFFERLKEQGEISAYTPVITARASTRLSASIGDAFSLIVIDPQTFPVVPSPTFLQPADGSFARLVQGQQVVVTKNFLDQYHYKVGDSLTIYVSPDSSTATGSIFHVTIAGVIGNEGLAATAGSTMYLSAATYQAAAPDQPLLYDSIYISTNNDQARADQVAKAVQNQFYYASTQTATDALKADEQQVDYIRKFLEIAGLLALLIGGVGIVHTMQVLLLRRRTEIAMLKTTGYRRRDLYLLFGLEAGLLGLVGGVIGSAIGLGVSLLARDLIMQLFMLNLPVSFDPLILGGGVLIGLGTALIFGLMPIVQAVNIRPLSVIRDLPEGFRPGSYALTAGLLLLLSLLFCGMAIVVLNNNVGLGIGVVYGTFIFLGLLSLFFVLAVIVISLLPVPERLNVGFLALIVVALVIAGLITLVLPVFGSLLLLAAVAGLVVVFLPATWKANIKMALRNIGRQRARTTTTMLALFVGIFTIGLILILGQDLRDAINSSLARIVSFNVIVTANDRQAQQLEAQWSSVPGIQNRQHLIVTSCLPLTIDGVPLQTLLRQNATASSNPNNFENQAALFYLGSLQGFDLAHGQVPSQDVTIVQGRNLSAADAGSDNVLLPQAALQLAPLKNHLHLGSKITLISQDGKLLHTVTVVGIYRSQGITSSGAMLASLDLVHALSPGGQVTNIYYLKIDPAQLGKALDRMQAIAGAISVTNLANLGDYVNQFLSYIILTLSAIASLSLFAGIVIIANAVGLAMLERRRELGILKAVGYTSRSILGEVLLENGTVAGVGAFLAMLLVSLALSLLGHFVFNFNLGTSEIIVLALIVGAAVLSMAVAALVAWGAVRVRPLEVLRYE